MPETIEPANKQAILSGRDAVDAYREAHRLLHEQVKDRTVHEAHTPLLEQMLGSLDKEGFTSDKPELMERSSEILSKFWDASDDLNIKEIGFKDKADFDAKATETDRLALEGKWR